MCDGTDVFRMSARGPSDHLALDEPLALAAEGGEKRGLGGRRGVIKPILDALQMYQEAAGAARARVLEMEVRERERDCVCVCVYVCVCMCVCVHVHADAFMCRMTVA